MARRSRIRSRIRKSHFYTFRCLRPKTLDDQGPHVINGPGYTRIVHCNQPHLNLATKLLRYRSNYVSTTRYNMLTFLPKCLYEQFHRVANFYFLVAAIFSVFPLSPFNKWTMIAPLVFVVGLSMGKEALEDWRRFMQDVAVNSTRGKLVFTKGVGSLAVGRVGDGVKMSFSQLICYCCRVATFVGNLECDGQVYPLDPNQILLRDSKLRNTTYIYGVVVFTGHDTKVMQNSTFKEKQH